MIFQALKNNIFFQQIYYSLKKSSLELFCFVLLSKTACEVDRVLCWFVSQVSQSALNKSIRLPFSISRIFDVDHFPNHIILLHLPKEYPKNITKLSCVFILKDIEDTLQLLLGF